MIENTTIEETINRAFDGLDIMLGVQKRARLDDGTFKADDKTTPEVNEAWKSGKSPKKKATKKKVKKTK
tara:strand:- start:374 stop:580 length:207 start_codon:yes stop_codon:yes gene_type:complete